MKIFSPYPPEINAAVLENYADAEFTDKAGADIILPILKTPFRIGELFDIIDNPKSINIAGLKIDLVRKNISNGIKTIDITEKEAAILKYLADSGSVTSRDEMIKNVWGYADSTDSKTVENHIYRLRNKITEAYGQDIILTETNGYRLL